MILPDPVADLVIPLPFLGIGVRSLVMEVDAWSAMTHLLSTHSGVHEPFAERAVQSAVGHVEVETIRRHER